MRLRSLRRVLLGTRGESVLTAIILILGIAWIFLPSASTAARPPVTRDIAPSAPPSAPASVPSASAAARPVAVVAFGDSVPSGGNCGCSPFPFTYSGFVAQHTGTRVPTTNFATGGFTSADVRRQIETPAARAAIRKATTVVIMAGANDFPGAYGRALQGTPAEVAYRPVAATVRANIEATVRRIRALHAGPVDVAVLGYWNVFRDGKVGLVTRGPAGMASANEATAHANRALLEAATSTDAQYVDVSSAFKGNDGKTDPTPLLAFDGDHPNARGHRVLATTLYAALPNG